MKIAHARPGVVSVAVSPEFTNDATIIAKSVTDSTAFALIYERYASDIYRYAYRRVGDAVADDVVAETFLAAFRQRRRYDTTRPDARPWLYGIATKELATHRRREETRFRAMASAPIDPVSTDGMAEQVAASATAQANSNKLAAALAQLSEKDRHVLLLIAWADLSYEETAQALGIPVGTVRSRLNRARRVTRAAFGERNPTHQIDEA